MVDQGEILTRGGVYLARLDPSKKNEVGNSACRCVNCPAYFKYHAPGRICLSTQQSISKRIFEFTCWIVCER